MQNKIIIVGAGKIGRGFIADVFSGYHLIFADVSEVLVEYLNKANEYTIINRNGISEKTQVISDFCGYSMTSSELMSEATEATLMSISVFPGAFESMATFIAEVVRRRITAGVERNLDIIICANVLHAPALINQLTEQCLDKTSLSYYRSHIGLIGAIVLRMAIPATETQKALDPLVTVTNGYPELVLDKTAFKGQPPILAKIRYTENIEAEEIRKFYTYNTIHCLFAGVGTIWGLTTVLECTQNSDVMHIAEQALSEISLALQKTFGFRDMDSWITNLLQDMRNPCLGDELHRLGQGMVRKLSLHDRLIGPMLLCKKNGIMPYYLSIAAAGGYLFNDSSNETIALKKDIAKYGIRQTIIKYSGLANEPELVDLITRQYGKLTVGNLAFSDIRIQKITQAYALGFSYEKRYKGCAQCTIAALSEWMGYDNAKLFQAASGFSGGMAVTGDSCCGGYSGGIMLMSSLIGRRLERIDIDGDKDAQYVSYAMAQELHDRMASAYGSIICSRVHTAIFGRSFCLRTPEIREKFEEAGAHQDKCTTVIAYMCSIIAEIIMDNNLLGE